MKKYFYIIFLGFILMAVLICSEKGMETMKQVFQDKPAKDKIRVVIDPGHGGFDPGKVGFNDILEKDINLAISKKLQYFLEQNDIEVIMTRSEDVGLYGEGDRNKKVADLRKRVDLIQKEDPIIAISIHQNSFEQEKYKGAQVFYHGKSVEGKLFAETLQKQIVATMKDGNNRLAKANNDYYMLKKSICPLVIVECGFLSNREEAVLLADDAYQEKMAWAIHLGILQQINSMKQKQK